MKKTNYLLSGMVALVSYLLPTVSYAQAIGGGVYNTYFSCDGNMTSVGSNNMGQLGDGTSDLYDSIPGAVAGLSNAIAVAGSYHVLFVDGDGTVWTAGQNYGGECGNGTNTNVNPAYHITGLTGIIKVASGESHSLMLKSDGTVWACGTNVNGEFGDGTTTSSNVPVQIMGLTGIIDISVGSYHSIFLKNDGTVWTSGYDLYGQLGQGAGSTIPHPNPLQVDTFTNAIAVSAGDQGSIVVTADGSVWGFGYDSPYGKFGMGSSAGGGTPSKSTLLTDVVDAVCSRFHSIFIKSDGTAWAVGLNNKGQLGDGTTTNSFIPVQVSGLSDVVDAAVGYSHSIFLKNNGTVWVVGSNGYGQLGNGTTTDEHTAIQLNICGSSGGAPAAPSNLVLTPQKTQMAGQMELSWTDNSSDEDGFDIERSPDGSSWSPLTTVTTATYTDNGLTNGTQYCYRVSAYNGNGSSGYSNTECGTTLTVGVPTTDVESSVSAFPNPTSGILHISTTGSGNEDLQICVRDVSGRTVYTAILNQQTSNPSIDLSNLQNGVYVMTINDRGIQRLIIQK
jgi:alpha-tubulin suppressor-like RCC1 family protein